MAGNTMIETEVAKTRRQFLILNTAEYFLAGFFWLFAMIASPLLRPEEKSLSLFSSMFVLMLSNAFWEVLTGWYADKFRRQFSITAGFFWYGVGVLIMIAAVYFKTDGKPSLPLWLTGITLWSLGPAMLSGAKEAWLVDRCGFFSPATKDQLEGTFTQAATLGVVSKSLGAAYAALTLWFTGLLKGTEASGNLELGFLVSAGPPALAALFLCVRSAALKEEYWTQPEYQTSESLLAFLETSLRQLSRVPYRWFTLGFVGITGLNYVLSSTLGPYIANQEDDVRIAYLLAAVIFLEVVAGLVGRQLPRWLGVHARSRMRIPILAVLHLIPLPLAFFRIPFEFSLLCAALIFRGLQGLIMGTLADIGHRAIEDDSHRAILYSMSSALAALLVAIPCLFFIAKDGANGVALQNNIQTFWIAVVPLAVIFLALGSYLVSRHDERDESTQAR